MSRPLSPSGTPDLEYPLQFHNATECKRPNRVSAREHRLGPRRLPRTAGAGHAGARVFGRPALLSRLRHLVGLAARVGPLARGHRLLQPGHADLQLQVPLGAARRPPANPDTERLARPSTFVDARVPGTHHARTLAGVRHRSDRAVSAAVAVFAALVGFSSATQDIAIDAWRIDAADMSRQGALAAAYTWGYRGAIMVAGAAPLLLSDGLRLELRLCGDGGPDDRRRRRRAGGASRGPARRSCHSHRRHSPGARARGARMGRSPRDHRRRRAAAGLRTGRQCGRVCRRAEGDWRDRAPATRCWRRGRRAGASGSIFWRWWPASA